MFGAFQTFGKLGAIGKAISAAWTPSALWPTGTEPGMWIDPSNLTSQWQDSTGTTPVATPGTVADSSNPVGLALDLRLGATALTDPGNHLLQATSTARPLLSGRVNLLTYTENFEGATWYGSGSTGADILDWPVGEDKYQWLTLPANTPVRIEFDYSVASGPDGTFIITLLNGTIQNINATPTVQRYSGVHSTGTTNPYFLFGKVSSGTAFRVSRMSLVREADGALPYQPILTDGSSYSATGITPFQLYDGTDDGMATASFAAGTLTSNMDCLIAVRIQGGAQPIAGLYQLDQTKYFGVVAAASSAGTYGGCGTPSIYVDGTPVANTRDDLATALGAGVWHILEYRALDLSQWVNAGFGYYSTGYQFNGGQGGILLFPGGNTAGRDAARTWLGAKVGLTL